MNIDKIVEGYELALEDGDADERDYKNEFHLLIDNAIERLDKSEVKNKEFATWICQTIIRYYAHHVTFSDETRSRFNAFIKTHNMFEDLSENVLAALYAHQFESLPQIFTNHINAEDQEPPFPNPLDAVAHVQLYAGKITGEQRIRLMYILENNLLKYIPKNDRDSRSYEKLIEAIDAIDLSCPTEAPKKCYRNRLMLGEADFGYTSALIRKHAVIHSKLAQSIVSTEFLSAEALLKIYGSKVSENVTLIQSLGGTVRTSIDARVINKCQLPHRRYHRIHFNFPHDKSQFQARTLPVILKQFFQAAKEIQQVHDRIHMVLPTDRIDFYHSYVYDIYEASARAGYQLIKKRRFDDTRYPGYKHSITGVNSSAAVTEKGAREFIFERTNYTYENLLIQSPPRKKYIKYDSKTYNYPPHIDTDNDSSDYLTDEDPNNSTKSKLQ